MKKSELKKYIREIIISEVTMVGAKTDPSEAPEIAKTERTGIDTVKSAIAQAKKTGASVGVAESLVQEMATFYKVKDKAGFKKALSKYKELKGDKYDKNALGQLLVALDKEGEVDVKTLAKEKGKDTATWNNPNTRAALEKEGGEFTDYVEAGKGEKEEKPKAKKEEPKAKKETPKKEKTKSKKKDEDEEEVEDTWNKPEEDETEDEEKIEKKAQAAAKKGGSNLTKLNNVTTQLKELEKEMKELAGKYKKAEGKEKETLLDKLKEKTKTKKELEKMQDKLADLIG